MVSESSSNEMPDSVQQSSLQQIQAVGKEAGASEKMELVLDLDSASADHNGIANAACDTTLHQTPSGNESPPSKLRYGRIRNGRVSRKRINRKNAKVSLKVNGHIVENKEEQENITAPQSSPKSSETRLPTLRLIKRPKKQLSSSETYFIGTDTKEYTTQTHQDSQEVRRVSPLSLYTKVDGTTIVHVACKRYKRRPIHEDTPSSPQNATSQCDTGNKENEVSRLVSEIVTQVVEDENNDVRRLNLEQPGSVEQEVLQKFCLENKIDFEDFSDMRVFNISPLAKEDLSETSEYAQVPKKRRRYEKSPTASPAPPPHSPSPSSYDTRLRKRKLTTPPPHSALKNILTRSESRKQKKDENADLSEDTQKSEDIQIAIEEVTSSKEDEELVAVKQEDDNHPSAPVEETICVANDPVPSKAENISDSPVESCTAPSPSILKSSLQPSPSSSPEIISQHSCSSESSISTTRQEDIIATTSSPKCTSETPLDLTTCKSALDFAATRPTHRTLILNAIPKTSTHQPIFNSPNKTNSSSSSNSKRSLTVKKLLSLGREKQKTTKPSTTLSQEIMNNPSFNARNLMEQLSSGKISIEDESILRALLLDSTKGEIDISSANPALFQALNSKSPDLSALDSKHDIGLTEFLNDPNIKNNSELMDNIKKLKNEIICLELMAEQKDKERVAIICFKKYKEELMKRFLKRHASNQNKEKLSLMGPGRPAQNPGYKHPFPSQREPVPKPKEPLGVPRDVKVEETPRSEPLNLHLSPLMFRLANSSPRPRAPAVRPPSQCSALKEQLLAKPKPIAPKPTETRRGAASTSQPRPTPASQHSILTSCLQAPVRNPYPLNWLAQPELPSRKSSSPPEQTPATSATTTTTSEIHQCNHCGTKHASFLCSGCQKEWYCSPRCQMIKWPNHAPICFQTSAASKNS